MLFTGLEVRIETYLTKVRDSKMSPRANIFLYGLTKTVNNFFFFSLKEKNAPPQPCE